MSHRCFSVVRVCCAVWLIAAAAAPAQEPAAAPHPPPGAVQNSQAAPDVPPEQAPGIPENYALGPGDEISLWVLEAEEIPGDPITIGADGYIHLPLAGRVRAEGRTATELEAALREKLGAYLHDPKVVVTIRQLRSKPISVIGAVRHPGLIQLRGETSLVEALSQAGGLLTEAGEAIKITRRPEWGAIPLPQAQRDASGEFSVAEINVKDIMEASNPRQNIRVLPHDVISVPRAEMAYVVGHVERPGGFPLNGRESISALQALALAGGLKQTAKAKQARILKTDPATGQRSERPINLRKVIDGDSPDVRLKRNDILFVPKSGGQIAALRAAEAALRIGVGIAIFSNR